MKWTDRPEKPIPPVKVSKAPKCNALHTISLRQTEFQKEDGNITAAAYLYQADNDGEWGELRFDFENGTAEIVKTCRLGYDKVQHLCKDGDSAHTELTGGKAAK